MPSKIRIIPWIEGLCSLYAIERDGISLPADFMKSLESTDYQSARQLWLFLSHVRSATYVREAQIRSERPELGVYALYNHREFLRAAYNPSRLLCSYVGETNNILLVGAGFVKHRNEPIQMNEQANQEAMFLGFVARRLNERIAAGEIRTAGSRLTSIHEDSFTI